MLISFELIPCAGELCQSLAYPNDVWTPVANIDKVISPLAILNSPEESVNPLPAVYTAFSTKSLIGTIKVVALSLSSVLTTNFKYVSPVVKLFSISKVVGVDPTTSFVALWSN